MEVYRDNVVAVNLVIILPLVIAVLFNNIISLIINANVIFLKLFIFIAC